MAKKNKKIEVKGTEITVISSPAEDYISITDIARFKDPKRTDYIIQNWLRNRNTIEFLGIWERLNNPNFNPIEFEGFRNKAGLNSFVLTAKQWIENLNAVFINDGLSQDVRLERLNKIAISQMKILTGDSEMKRLEGKE